MAFGLFKKIKKEFEFPERAEIEVPPTPLSIPKEEPFEFPMFPSAEEDKIGAKAEKPKKEVAPPTVENIEEEAVSSVKEGLEERESLELAKPLFIEGRLYKGMIDDIGVLKNTLKNSSDELMKIGDLKDDREKSYSVWHKQMEDIQRKLIYIDNILFGKSRS